MEVELAAQDEALEKHDQRLAAPVGAASTMGGGETVQEKHFPAEGEDATKSVLQDNSGTWQGARRLKEVGKATLRDTAHPELRRVTRRFSE